MNYVLAPSILSANFNELGREIKKTEDNGAKYLHFDVMDGMFVPNISFGLPVMKSIKSSTHQVMDAHLMVQDPIRYVKQFREAGADLITVHFEACPHVKAALYAIRDTGAKVGLSICPDTPVEVLEEYLPLIDMVLVMSVYPGAGGQKFMPESLPRIHKIREMIEAAGLDIDIQVDGGIGLNNVKKVMEAGANIFVAGSGVFDGDAAANTQKFMQIFHA